MADISNGPVSTLPGYAGALPDGTKCDVHPERPAKARIQGETDSFGCEYNDLCQECIDELREHSKQDRNGVCDWCRKEATDLRKRRDIEEGFGGPVYDVCGACVKKQLQAWQEDSNDYDDYDDGDR